MTRGKRIGILLASSAGVFFVAVGILTTLTDLPLESTSFASLAELQDFEARHVSDISDRRTFYCGDDVEGLSWFADIEHFGVTGLYSVPASTWKPSRRMPYTHWRPLWQARSFPGA